MRRLDLVGNHVSQRRVDDLPRVVGLLRRPMLKPCATAAIPCCWSILGSVVAEIGFPPRIGNTSGLLSPSARAVSRISSARRNSGTSAAVPGPSSRRRPRMTSRWIQLRVPAGWTK